MTSWMMTIYLQLRGKGTDTVANDSLDAMSIYVSAHIIQFSRRAE
jgi:hypothetical protein